MTCRNRWPVGRCSHPRTTRCSERTGWPAIRGAAISMVWMLSSLLLADESSRQDSATAREFAIETKVFVGDADQPSETHLTIFRDNRVLDVTLGTAGSTIEFDRSTRDFQMSHQTPPMITRIAAEELVRFSASLQAKALEAEDPLIRFAAQPEFTQKYDADQQRLSLNSPFWNYDVQLIPIDDDQVLQRYREFADWFTYLNSLFRPLPPGIRLELNQALDRRQCIPRQVTVTVHPPGDVAPIRQRSEHRLIQPLGQRERAALSQWDATKDDLPLVQFGKFHSSALRR